MLLFSLLPDGNVERLMVFQVKTVLKRKGQGGKRMCGQMCVDAVGEQKKRKKRSCFVYREKERADRRWKTTQGIWKDKIKLG